MQTPFEGGEKPRRAMFSHRRLQPVAAAIVDRLLQPSKIGCRSEFELPFSGFAFARSAFRLEFDVVDLRQPEQVESSAEAMADDVSR